MARLLVNSLCAAGVLALALASAQEAGSTRQELLLGCGPVAFNGQTNMFQCKAPRIRRGDLYIAADDAAGTGVEFDTTSEWRFNGNVRVEAGTAVMNADSAVFTFEQERLARGELEGAPASFQHLDAERNKPATGTANKISYDEIARTLRLSGDVVFQREQTEVRGCDIIYNMRTEGFSSGDSDCGVRVRRSARGSDQQNETAPPQ